MAEAPSSSVLDRRNIVASKPSISDYLVGHTKLQKVSFPWNQGNPIQKKREEEQKRQQEVMLKEQKKDQMDASTMLFSYFNTEKWGILEAAQLKLMEAMAAPRLIEEKKSAEKKESEQNPLISREKIITNARLANLAYTPFTRLRDINETPGEIVPVYELSTDSFSHADNLEKAGKNASEQEKLLLNFKKKTSFKEFIKNFSTHRLSPLSDDSAKILSRMNLPPFARNELRSQIELLQKQDPKTSLEDSELSLNILQLIYHNEALEYVRDQIQKKRSDEIISLEKKGFSIIDFFPDQSRQESGESGFAAIALKDKQGRIHISIRGTEITDTGDGKADGRLTIGRLPMAQVRDLILFTDSVLAKTPSKTKLCFEGHSLGGALAQIGSVMYDSQVDETYTFHAPGGKWLKGDISSETDPAIRKRLEKYRSFVYGINNNSVENRMVNVRPKNWWSPIANLGEDVGYHEILVDGEKSHSIEKIREKLLRTRENQVNIYQSDIRFKQYEERVRAMKQSQNQNKKIVR